MRTKEIIDLLQKFTAECKLDWKITDAGFSYYARTDSYTFTITTLSNKSSVVLEIKNYQACTSLLSSCYREIENLYALVQDYIKNMQKRYDYISLCDKVMYDGCADKRLYTEDDIQIRTSELINFLIYNHSDDGWKACDIDGADGYKKTINGCECRISKTLVGSIVLTVRASKNNSITIRRFCDGDLCSLFNNINTVMSSEIDLLEVTQNLYYHASTK